MHTTARSLTLSEAANKLVPRRVLIAEDDLQMRHLITRNFEHAGFEVTGAASGTEALALLAEALIGESPERFNLIVSDVRMPGCSGLQLLASTGDEGMSQPVILITAFGTPETHAQAKRLGAFAVFDKPFDIDDLVIAALAAVPRSVARLDEEL
jgi:DNA-binding NtrC family response regulator